MCERKGPVQSRKRIAKVLQQDESWDCSVCTYSNSPEAFKCLMCNVRKGTSTRKPRLNQHIVAQQEATKAMAQSCGEGFKDFLTEEETEEEENDEKSEYVDEKWKSNDDPWDEEKLEKKIPKSKKSPDKNSHLTLAVTVNNQTVMFTEFKTRKISLDNKAKKQIPTS